VGVELADVRVSAVEAGVASLPVGALSSWGVVGASMGSGEESGESEEEAREEGLEASVTRGGGWWRLRFECWGCSIGGGTWTGDSERRSEECEVGSGVEGLIPYSSC